jgi:hypothetical protein
VKQLIKKKTRLEEVLSLVATKAETASGTYYYIPFWFKQAGEFNVEVVEVDNIPEDLKEFLTKQRMIIAKIKKDEKAV